MSRISASYHATDTLPDGRIAPVRELGVRHLDATVLAQNTRIARLLRKTGLPLHSSLDEGIRTLSLAP